MNQHRPRILVVDDSATSRTMLEKQLLRSGCEVECAQDGGSALAALARTHYDLVLLDCYMPDMNGYEVAREVRRREEGAATYTPLIGISAEVDAAHTQLCLDSGMDGMLGKPLPQDQFKHLLALWCDFDPVQEAPVAYAEQVPPDLESLFRQTSLHDLDAMALAHRQSERDVVMRLAHRMKGAALTMQRPVMVSLLERIESSAGAQPEAEGDVAALIQALRQALG
ncbi:response regulator [Herbaspirillum sp. YR522]|uniref:response regulator n=1 Tax=Herbaspirillum sp. YR522 TaxID=1144342 RepID=UPI00026F768B|nr:response regulator [Herbaspirillum sp. YR522]EJN07057.1 response regulator with CheY-like receiver domain and winged-helix DNA-binding domain [Herbaspirillum sp. YR522]